MKDYVFDSYAIIAFFEDEPGADTVEKALRQIAANKARGWMSVINWGEVYYSTFREQGPDAAEKVMSQLAMYPLVLVDADRSQTLEAAILKGKYRVAYADCFTVALAKRTGGEILTGDAEFRKFQEDVKIRWIS